MSKLLTSLLAVAGIAVAATSNIASPVFFIFDEPEMPKSLIER